MKSRSILVAGAVFGIMTTYLPAAAENDALIDRLVSEIDFDKTRLDAKYETSGVAATFEACFQPYGVIIRGVNHKPTDYQYFGEHNLTQPYTQNGVPFFAQNRTALLALKEADGVSADKITDAMDVYRSATLDLAQTLFTECDIWAKRNKWEQDSGVNNRYGTALTDAQLTLLRNAPYKPTDRIKARDAALERIARINAFRTVSAVAETNQPHTVAELIERLRQEARRAGPPAPGQSVFYISEAQLTALKQELDALGLNRSDWTYLIARHFNQSGEFDPAQWTNFASYAKNLAVTDTQKAHVQAVHAALKQRLGLSDTTIAALDEPFYRGTSLHRPTVASDFGYNYDAYLINRLAAPDAALNSTLTPQQREELKKIFAAAPGEPEQPSMYGVDRIQWDDCSWNTMLERMKRADPSFAMKWNLYFIQGSIISFLGPGGAGGTTGVGTAYKRNVLVTGVREAIRRCKAGQL